MKKQLLLLSAVALIGAGSLSAQTCTPDAFAVMIGIPGVYPNPVQTSNLTAGAVGNAYTETITLITLADTTIDLSAQVGFPVPPVTASVNYQEVTGVTGLPAGLNYACNPANCQVPGDSSGCVSIYGTPTAGGTFTVGLTTGINISVPVTVPVIGGQNITIPVPGISWDLEISGGVGMTEMDRNGFSLAQNAPNPFSGSTNIVFSSSKPAVMDLMVTDLTGRVLAQSSHRASVGENVISFDASSFAPGVYMYRLSNGSASQMRKMVVTE